MINRYKIGQITNPVALRGEVKVYNYSDYKERFEEIPQVIAVGTGKNKTEKTYEIEKVRYQQNMVVLKLKGIDDRNGAETLKGMDLYITEDDLRELPEDTFYIKDLIGMKVIDDTTGKEVGKIKDVIQNTAQDIYQIAMNNGKEALIPVVKEFIKEVSLETGRVVVTPIPGMIDETGVTDED